MNKPQIYSVCATACSGDAALEALKTVAPDIAIIDSALKGIDGIKLLDHVKSIRPECVSFMMSEFDDNRIVNSAINHGAIYYFVKPVSPQIIAERVGDILNDKVIDYKVSAEIRDKRKAISLDEKISNIFTTIGIPPHIKGYVYLREGIKMAVEDNSIINKVTKELYPKIGENTILPQVKLKGQSVTLSKLLGTGAEPMLSVQYSARVLT